MTTNQGTSVILTRILLMFFGWIFLLLFFFYIAKVIPPNGLAAKTASPLSLFFFILAASSGTGYYLNFIEDFMKAHKYFRLALVIAFSAIVFLLWKYSVITGTKSPFLQLPALAALLLFANLTGAWIAGKLAKITEIAVLSFVMILADMISVIKGPSAKIASTIEIFYNQGMAGDIPFADFILFKFPFPGRDYLVPVFGVSDWIMVVFFSAASIKFCVRDNLWQNPFAYHFKKFKAGPGTARDSFLYFPTASAGLFFGVMLAWTTNLFIPALPVVAIFYCGVLFARYPDSRKFDKKEKFLTSVFALAIASIGGFISFFLK